MSRHTKTTSFPSQPEEDVSFNPWLSNQLMQNWFHLQKILWMNTWEIGLWQHTILQKMFMDNTQWMLHGLQLSHQPTTLLYETLANHSVTSTQWMSRIWIQSFYALQDGWKCFINNN